MESGGLIYLIYADKPLMGLLAIIGGGAFGFAIYVAKILSCINKKTSENSLEFFKGITDLEKKIGDKIDEVEEKTALKIDANNKSMVDFVEKLAKNTAEEIANTNKNLSNVTELVQNLTGQMLRHDSRLTILEASVLTRDVLVRIETFLRAMSKNEAASAICGIVEVLSEEIQNKAAEEAHAKSNIKFGRRSTD